MESRCDVRHYDKVGNWGVRKRIWRHPLIGPRLFHDPLGFGRITRMWQQMTYHAHVEPHYSTWAVVEFTTDTGLRYVMDYMDFGPNVTDENGKLVKDSPLWDGFDGHLKGRGWKRFFAQMKEGDR